MFPTVEQFHERLFHFVPSLRAGGDEGNRGGHEIEITFDRTDGRTANQLIRFAIGEANIAEGKREFRQIDLANEGVGEIAVARNEHGKVVGRTTKLSNWENGWGLDFGRNLLVS